MESFENRFSRGRRLPSGRQRHFRYVRFGSGARRRSSTRHRRFEALFAVEDDVAPLVGGEERAADSYHFFGGLQRIGLICITFIGVTYTLFIRPLFAVRRSDDMLDRMGGSDGNIVILLLLRFLIRVIVMSPSTNFSKYVLDDGLTSDSRF